MPATVQKRRASSNQVVSFNYKRQSSGLADTSVSQAEPRTISLPISTFQTNAVPATPPPSPKPHLVPLESPGKRKSSRRIPFLVRVNKAIQTGLVALCGLAICAYGLDVVVTHDVSKLQEQARRLSERNSELSAPVVEINSYGELQAVSSEDSDCACPIMYLLSKNWQRPKHQHSAAPASTSFDVGY
ncbi:MAG: hypothetical protein R3D26_08150 [Cyanobacteriota/Melainabacteria group bacterium]